MARLTPVEYDPFAQPGRPAAPPAAPRLTPVNYDPFAQSVAAQPARDRATVENQGLASMFSDGLVRLNTATRGLVAGVTDVLQPDAAPELPSLGVLDYLPPIAMAREYAPRLAETITGAVRGTGQVVRAVGDELGTDDEFMFGTGFDALGNAMVGAGNAVSAPLRARRVEENNRRAAAGLPSLEEETKAQLASGLSESMRLRADEIAGDYTSDAGKLAEKELQRALKDGTGSLLGYAFENPLTTASIAGPQSLPYMLPALGAARFTGSATAGALTGANTEALNAGADAEAAVLNAQEDELPPAYHARVAAGEDPMQVRMELAREAGDTARGTAATLTSAASVGGLAATRTLGLDQIEDIVARTGMTGARGRAANSLGTAAAEGVTELPEEFAAAIAQNSAGVDSGMRDLGDLFNPEATAQGVLGSLLGGTMGGLTGALATPNAPATPKPEANAGAAQAKPAAPNAPNAGAAQSAQPVTPEADEAAAEDILNALMNAGIIPPVSEQGGSPEPVAPAAGSQPGAAVSPDLGEQFAGAAPSMPAPSPSAPLAERLQGDGAVTGPAPTSPGSSVQQARPPLSVRMGDQEFAVDSYEDASSKFLELKARGDIGGMKAIELIDQNGAAVGFIGQSGEVYNAPLSSLKSNPNTLPVYRPPPQSDRAPIDSEATRITGSLPSQAAPNLDDRIGDLVQKREAGALSPAESAQLTDLLLQSRVTNRVGGKPLDGVLNMTAKADKQRRGELLPVQGFLDADDFKNFNDLMGHDTGDQVIRDIASALQASLGSDNVFHRGGDEFEFQGADESAIQAAIEQARQSLAGITYAVTKADGSVVEMRGVGFSSGIGADTKAAEAAQYADKEQRKAAGLRTGIRGADRRATPADASRGLGADQGRGREGGFDQANQSGALGQTPAEVAPDAPLGEQFAGASIQPNQPAPSSVVRGGETPVQYPSATEQVATRKGFDDNAVVSRRDVVQAYLDEGIDPDFAERLANNPKLPTGAIRDDVTGYFDGKVSGAKVNTVKRAQEHSGETGEDAVYVSGDIFNLGGLNGLFKNNMEAANVHFRAMTDFALEALRETGADVVPMRTGGDEVGFVVVNASQEVVNRALETADARIQEYAQANGFDRVPHTKAERAGQFGIGLHFGTAKIRPKGDIKRIMARADAGVDASKNRGKANESGSAIRPAGLGGQDPGADRAGSNGDAGRGASRGAGLAGREGAPVPERADPAPNSEDDARAGRSEEVTRDDVLRLRKEIGWDSRGGYIIRGGAVADDVGNGASAGRSSGDVIGRTKWEPKARADGGGNSSFWSGRPMKISEAEANAAFDRLAAGEALTKKQQRFIDYAEKTARDYAQERAENAAEAASPPAQRDEFEDVAETNAALDASFESAETAETASADAPFRQVDAPSQSSEDADTSTPFGEASTGTRFKPLRELPAKRGDGTSRRGLVQMQKALAQRLGRGLDPDENAQLVAFMDQFAGHFSDIGLSFRRGGGAQGQFHPENGVVEIFARAIEDGSIKRTTLHEFWHVLARALEDTQVEAVKSAYRRAKAAWKKANPELAQLMEAANWTLEGAEAQAWMRDTKGADDFESGKRVIVRRSKDKRVQSVRLARTDETYRYTNVDEFFAEEMTDRTEAAEVSSQARGVLNAARKIMADLWYLLRRIVGRAEVDRLFRDYMGGRVAPEVRRRSVAEDSGEVLSKKDGPFEPITAFDPKVGAASGRTRIGATLESRKDYSQASAEAARKRATVNSSLGNPMAGGALGWNPVKGKWEGSRETLRKARAATQDKFISLRDLQEDIEAATGMDLPDAQNVYRLENLMHGRVQDGILNIERQHLDPLFAAMRKAGVEAKTLEDYLYARHAEERNKHIAKINAEMPDGGSGMTTKAARDALKAADTAKLEPLAERVDALMADTRKRLLDSGVITREQYDAMESQYQHYVPLRGRDESKVLETVDRGGGMGRGIEQRSSGIKRAAGRKSLAVNLLGEAMADAQRAVIAAEKARVGRAVARLVLANPNPNLWEIEAVRTERKFDAQGNVYEAVVNESAEPDVIHVLIQGKPYRVRIVNHHVIQALKNLGANELHNFLRPLAWMNRYVSATLTSYNPGFIAVNLTRDAVFGTTRILAEDGIATYGSTVAGYGPAMKAITLNEANAAGSKPMDNRLREFLGAGGKTGWVSMNAVEDLQKAIWIDSSGQLTAAGVRGVRAIGRFVESANVVVENAMRLAYFSALRDRGLSIEKAAERAKNLTLNFNRKGRFANAFSAAYLFFNPAIQGTHVLGKLAKNPKALAMVGTIAAAQAVLAMLAAGIEDEDGETLASKVPEYIKERNLWAVIPGERDPTGKLLKGEKDRIVTLPMPFGFNVLPYSASVGVDVFTKDMAEIAAGAKSPVGVASSIVGRLTNAFVGATAPIPMNDGIAGFIPTIPGQIATGWLTNKDSLGRQIRQPQFDLNNPEPLAYNPRPETPQAFVQMAQGLNWLGGGDEFRRPVRVLDWAPEDFEYAWGWVTGGAGRFATDVATGGYNFFADPEAEENKGAPIAKAFTQPLNQQGAVLGAYYQRADSIEEQERRIRTIAARDGVDAAMDHADSVPFMAGIVVREEKGGGIEIKPGSSDVYDAYRKSKKALKTLRAEERVIYEEQGRDIINVERARLLRDIRAQRVEAVKDVNLYWNEAVRPLSE